MKKASTASGTRFFHAVELGIIRTLIVLRSSKLKTEVQIHPQHDQVRAATQFNYRTALRANRGFRIPDEIIYLTNISPPLDIFDLLCYNKDAKQIEYLFRGIISLGNTIPFFCLLYYRYEFGKSANSSGGM